MAELVGFSVGVRFLHGRKIRLAFLFSVLLDQLVLASCVLSLMKRTPAT